MKYITAIVIWVLFVLAAIGGFVAGLAALIAGKTRYASNVAHAQDCAAAAFLGWDGQSTISKECGRELAYAAKPCRFCRWLCKVLDVVLEKGHCEKEAA
jgi:hypothetical protein